MHTAYVYHIPIRLYVSFAKEPYKRDDILQKRPMILRSLLIVATPHQFVHGYVYTLKCIPLKNAYGYIKMPTATYTHENAYGYINMHTANTHENAYPPS